MTNKMVEISEEEFKKLKVLEKVDKKHLEDIAKGIKDILKGKVKEV